MSIRLAVALLLAVVLLRPPGAQAQPILVVTDPWPPRVFSVEGTVTGFDYETAKAVLKGLGHDMIVSFYPWKRCLQMVETGEADAILDVGRTPEREAAMLFPDEPLSASRTVVFHPADVPFVFKDLSDLRGLTVGVESGYHHSSAFAEAEGFTRAEVSHVEFNIRKLLRGRVDVFVANREYGLFTAKSLGVLDDVAHSPTPLNSGNVYLAFTRKGNHAKLAADFGRELRRFKATEAYRAILGEYGLAD